MGADAKAAECSPSHFQIGVLHSTGRSLSAILQVAIMESMESVVRQEGRAARSGLGCGTKLIITTRDPYMVVLHLHNN